MDRDNATPTGLPNEVYDLVLVLQQTAANIVRYSAFADDARSAGDFGLADWFTSLAESDRAIVRQARRFLAERLDEPAADLPLRSAQ